MTQYTAYYADTTYKATSLQSLVMLLHRLGAGPFIISPDIIPPKKMPKGWVTVNIEETEEETNQQ